MADVSETESIAGHTERELLRFRDQRKLPEKAAARACCVRANALAVKPIAVERSRAPIVSRA